MLPGQAKNGVGMNRSVRGEQSVKRSRLSGLTDWILRYIKTTFFYLRWGLQLYIAGMHVTKDCTFNILLHCLFNYIIMLIYCHLSTNKGRFDH